MRLKSVSVSNYRIHSATKLEFDPKLTLITGPNESGKSTLVEAIHRALFLRAKVGGAVLEEMKSTSGGNPRVELVLDIDGHERRLTKEFTGTKGSSTLTQAGQPALSGDAAEDKLAELLHAGTALEGRGAANQLPRKWAHLWVWQGSAGNSPTESVAEQQDTLVQRLQTKGGAAVMQSDLDARVLRGIQTRRDAIFTDRGEPKKGSDLAKASEELKTAQTTFEEKQRILQSLEEAVAHYNQALNTIEEKKRTQTASSLELDEAGKKLLQAEELNRTLEPIIQRQKEAASSIGELEKIAANLAVERQERDDATAALAPHEQALKTLKREQVICSETLQQAEKTWGNARTGAGAARLWKNALDAHLLALEKKQELDKLKADQATIAAKRTKQQAVRDDLARTPKVEQKDIGVLQKMHQELTATRSAHDALGARIEIIASRSPVVVDGKPLKTGSSLIITSDAVVAIGSAAKLSIKPGGNTGIVEARRAFEKAQQKYAAKLGELTVATIEDAAAAYEKSRGMNDRIAALQADLDRLDADDNEQLVLDCEQVYAGTSRRAGNAATESRRKLPVSFAETRQAVAGSEKEVQLMELTEKTSEAAFKVARAKSGKLDADVLQANAEAGELRRQVDHAAIRIKTIEEQHGNAPDRAGKLLELQTRHTQAVQEQRLLQSQLDKLQPEQLRSDVDRLNGAVKRAQDEITTATAEKAAVGERLRLNGTTDPHDDLEKARAMLERTESRRNELCDQADAIKYLATLAEEVQESVAQLINKPLEDAAQGYLERIFGPGSRMKLEHGLQVGGAMPLNVIREQAGLGNFKFETLSGGAREQVGIAMRLAMAEVLAVDHAGSLPVILDDAFANSDPERVKLLQSMLFRAAERGLQIIVLTCNPSDYGTLNAKEIRLERPKPQPVQT
ncbi:MAG: AAA family ATPase [bacterium]